MTGASPSPRPLLAWLLLGLWALAPAPSARAAARAPSTAPSALEKALEQYYGAQYREALALFDTIAAQPSLTPDERVRCLQYQAFTLFALGLLPGARATWEQLLRLRPDHQLDAEEVPPELMSFFSRIKPLPPAPPPTPTPAPPVPPQTAATPPASTQATSAVPPSLLLRPAQATQPGERRATLTPAAADARTDAVANANADADAIGIMLRLVPFGVGQYANHQPVKGALFSVFEAGCLATNLGTAVYLAQSDLGQRDPRAYNKRILLQNITLGCFAVVAVAGVVEAFASWE